VRLPFSSSGAHRHDRSTLDDDFIFRLTTHRSHHSVVARRRRLVATIATIHLARAGGVLRPPASSVDARPSNVASLRGVARPENKENIL